MRAILEQNVVKCHVARTIALAIIVAGLAGVTRCQQTSSLSSAQRNTPMPEYIQEFFLSEAVRSQDKGELQVTFAVDSRRKIGTNTDVQIEYGLTDRFQVSLGTTYGITTGNIAEIPQGWSSTTVGALYQIIRSDQPFALSAGMAFALPIHSRDHLAYEPSLLAAKTFRKLQIHASFLSEVEYSKNYFEYNVACVYPLKSQWFPTFEVNGRRLDAKNGQYLTPGIYRNFRHRLEIGIGVPLGLGGVAGSLGIVVKMNWELGGER